MVFGAGGAEVDEPLAVEESGHLFQYLDTPLIVLDQVVIADRMPAIRLWTGSDGTLTLTSPIRDGAVWRIFVPLRCAVCS